jgi:hypothetical protein
LRLLFPFRKRTGLTKLLISLRSWFTGSYLWLRISTPAAIRCKIVHYCRVYISTAAKLLYISQHYLYFLEQYFMLKSIILWDLTPCSPLSFNRRFGGIYRLNLHGRRNSFSKPASKQVTRCLPPGLLKLFLKPWSWRRYVPPKRRLKLNGLHAVISQKMILFITTAVKTSNPTMFYDALHLW